MTNVFKIGSQNWKRICVIKLTKVSRMRIQNRLRILRTQSKSYRHKSTTSSESIKNKQWNYELSSRLLEERQAARVKQQENIEPIQTPPETSEIQPVEVRFSDSKNNIIYQKQMKRRTPNTVRIEDTYGVERKADKMPPIQEQPTSQYKVTNLLLFRCDRQLKPHKRDRLYGLGSTWCIAPRCIWKHIGISGEPEIITRRKCITLLLSIVLLLLVLGTVES